MTLTELFQALSATMPLNIVVVWACALLLIDLTIQKERKWITALLAAIGLVVAMGFAIAQAGLEHVAFNGMIVVDGFAVFLILLVLGSGVVGIALAYDYLKRMGIERGEYYVLLMFSISGVMIIERLEKVEHAQGQARFGIVAAVVGHVYVSVGKM